jgi:hypothetical protein
MPIIVKRIARVGDSVDSMYVVDIAVAVIVDAIAPDLIWVGPHVRRQVRMGIKDTCVHDEGEY